MRRDEAGSAFWWSEVFRVMPRAAHRPPLLTAASRNGGTEMPSYITIKSPTAITHDPTVLLVFSSVSSPTATLEVVGNTGNIRSGASYMQKASISPGRIKPFLSKSFLISVLHCGHALTMTSPISPVANSATGTLTDAPQAPHLNCTDSISPGLSKHILSVVI
jgi:hypothetical protein